MKVTPKVRQGYLVLMVAQGQGAAKPRALGIPLEESHLSSTGFVSSKAPGAHAIRSLIRKHRDKLVEIYVNLLDENMRKPTLEEILVQYDKWKKNAETDVISNKLMDHWVAYSDYRWLKLRKKKNSFKKVEDTENDLWTLNKKKTLLLSDVGPSMTQDFIDMLIAGEGYSGKVNTNNTVKKKLGEFKRFLEYCRKKRLHDDIDYDAPGIEGYEPIEPSYSEVEINLMLNLDISAIPGFREIYIISRDLYVFCAHTGVSFGDLKHVNDDNITYTDLGGKKIPVLSYRRNKTTVQAFVPLNKVCMGILNKYGGVLPSIANQTANKCIKEVARSAGIDGIHVYVRWAGGIRIEDRVDRWRAIKFHSSRASFTTNNLMDGVDLATVANMNGQKNTDTTKKYFRPGADRQIRKYIGDNIDEF